MAYTTIDDPSAYFYAYAFTKSSGSGSATFDGNSDLQPDFLWVKSRTNADSHELWDSTRGVSATLFSNSSEAEDAADNRLTSFNSDGFSWGTAGNLNAAGDFVSWAWKANGGTTSTNSDGDINSTVQVNSTAGFSIVQYNPSNTTARSIGHGLGVQPQVVIVRARDRAENWRVFHRSAGTTGSLILDDASAYNSSTVLFTGDSTSTVFKVGTDFSVNGAYNYIAYCFANVQGYSKFGSYEGNGDATDGPFIYTGFSPAWVMIKNIETANRPWYMFDNQRRTFNPNGSMLEANTADAEATDQAIDMLSNGFKIRPDALGSYGTSSLNHSGQTMVYMAFAENPFVSSGGIPTTAR